MIATRPEREARRGERGQSSVEFGLIVPVFFVLVLLAAQVAALILSQIAVTHAAREVARAVSVDPTVVVDDVADRAGLFASGDLDVQVDRRSSSLDDRDLIEVVVTTDVPQVILVSWVLPEVVSARVATLSEQ